MAPQHPLSPRGLSRILAQGKKYSSPFSSSARFPKRNGIKSSTWIEAWDEEDCRDFDSEDELKECVVIFIFLRRRLLLSLESLSQATNVEKSIYMCNSLGCMPIRARHYVSAELDMGNIGCGGSFDEPLPWVSIDESVRDGLRG